MQQQGLVGHWEAENKEDTSMTLTLTGPNLAFDLDNDCQKEVKEVSLILKLMKIISFTLNSLIICFGLCLFLKSEPLTVEKFCPKRVNYILMKFDLIG